MALDFQWCFVAVLLILPLIYELSSTFRYYAKMTLFVILVNVISVFVIILSLWRPCDVENYRYVSMIVRELRPLFGVDLQILGYEHLQTEEPCVVVANHQTCLDFLGMMEAWPNRCAALAKRSLQYMFPFSLAAILTGTVFIDRGNKEQALGTMNRVAEVMKEKKIKVYIFPEGTRNRDGSMKPFKKGAFHLAVQAQVPILPVVFSSYKDFYSRKDKRFDTGKLTVTCMPKISTEGLTAEDVPAFTEKVREQMLVVFNQMCTEARLAKGTAGSR